MNVDKFGQKIETFREYVNNLLQHNTLEGLPLQQLEQALEEFSVTLEELEVAQEELLQQNEELQTARQKAETERQRAETERQKAETERQRAEVEPQRYQDLFEQAPDGYFVTTKEGTIQEVNRAAATLLNYSQNFLISKSIFDFIVEQERPAFQTELAQPRIGDWVREWEVRFLVRDRKPVDVALTVAAVRNPQNKVQTLRWQLRDITEKKQAERYATFLDEASRLLASSLDYRTTLNHVAKLAVPTLADWCFIDIIENNLTVFDNPVVVASDPKKEALVLELRRRYPPSPDADYGAPKVLRTGIPELVTEIPDSIPLAIASDAEHLDLLLQLEAKSYMIVPLTIQERKLGTISFASSQPGRHYTQKDLAMATELARRAAIALDNARLYREAQAANRLKDEFLAIVSHELRTPLHAILGWAKMLRNRKLNEATTNKALATIERNAKLQEKLIEDILDISRIVQGKIRLNTRPVYLAPIIDAVIENMHPTADIKNIQIESMLDSSVGQVMGDAERLQQIVWNLLSNAVKFTPAGGRVEVRLEQLNNNAQITISDTGIGITPNFLPYIFDRFRQADSTTTRSHNGLGLGLAIVRHLVEMHSGTVYAA
ncbi:MAG: histidine kinase, partial [Mastigocladus sp. ERB_26_1]